MSVFDTYLLLTDLKTHKDFPVAETMYLLNREGDIDLDSVTLQRLAEKTLDVCYTSGEPLLHAERVEAVRSIFDLGLKGQRADPFPELPKMSQYQLAEMLLGLSDDSFRILMDTVAYNNQAYYCSEYSGTEAWAQEIDWATKEIEAFLGHEETLDSRIETAPAPSQATASVDELPVTDELLRELNKLTLYTISLVNSEGYWDGSESAVKSFISEQECLDYAYGKYVATWQNASDEEAPDLAPLLSKNAFCKALSRDSYVSIPFVDFHVQIEFYEQEMDLVPQKASSLDAIICSAARTQQNQTTKEPNKSDELSH